VTRTAVQRRLRSRVRLLVDVEGYRSRRRESLTEYARSMARRAMERGTEIELEPMNAYERKLVHDAVAEIEGASSYSEGEEPNRKVIVRGE
jgi:spoIIIJ-associated protein